MEIISDEIGSESYFEQQETGKDSSSSLNELFARACVGSVCCVLWVLAGTSVAND